MKIVRRILQALGILSGITVLYLSFVTFFPLGLHLAAALKEFGLVHHSAWMELPG